MGRESSQEEMQMYFEMMEERGIKLDLDLKSHFCQRNSDCPLLYRMGGCCARTELFEAGKNMND